MPKDARFGLPFDTPVNGPLGHSQNRPPLPALPVRRAAVNTATAPSR